MFRTFFRTAQCETRSFIFRLLPDWLMNKCFFRSSWREEAGGKQELKRFGHTTMFGPQGLEAWTAGVVHHPVIPESLGGVLSVNEILTWALVHLICEQRSCSHGAKCTRKTKYFKLRIFIQAGGLQGVAKSFSFRPCFSRDIWAASMLRSVTRCVACSCASPDCCHIRARGGEP